MNVSMTEVTTTLADTGDTGAEQPCVGHPITDGCCCFDAQPENADLRVVCDVDFPCARIEFECTALDDLFCDETPLTTGCEEAIDCALGVLITGAPAGIRWSLDHRGWSGEEAVLYLAGDGMALLRRLEYEDVGATYDGVNRFPLHDKAYFEACAQRATAAERFECIRDCAAGEPVEMCSGGFSFDWI